MSGAYDELMAYTRDTQALSQIAGRLGWDQETMMPKGAAPQRAAEQGAMQKVLHARRMSAKVGDWLAAIEDATLDAVGQAQLRLIRRDFERTRKVPADLAVKIAELTSEAQGIWARARADDNVAAFLPTLKTVVDLKREEGAALAEGGDIYDAMLQDYEPGMTGDKLERIFADMRPDLVALRAAALERPTPQELRGAFAHDLQLRMSQMLAKTFGYDFTRGRIDQAVHPFSSGSGLDVRITTRTDPADPFNCIYSTIHEVGHACYEQGIDNAYFLTPLGQGVSMGVHESQSRIYENQLGRSRAFTGWLFGKMRDAFGDFGPQNEDAFYKTVNQLKSGYIRTEADEVQYNLHIVLRFDLERALMSGDLNVADLETAWNDRFEADFGYPVTRASNGLLQDVHWSVGLFGYFPTYSLGNVYAGCLYAKMREAIPELDAHLSRGETQAATEWLRSSVQRHGGLYEPSEVIARACGVAPSAVPLVDYLKTKFSDLYAL